MNAIAERYDTKIKIIATFAQIFVWVHCTAFSSGIYILAITLLMKKKLNSEEFGGKNGRKGKKRGKREKRWGKKEEIVIV